MIRPLDEPVAAWLRAFGPPGALRVGAALLVKPGERDRVVEGLRHDEVDVED